MPSQACQPGDIVVRPTTAGFLVSRVVKANGHGSEWQYVGSFLERRVAMACARSVARQAKVSAWLEGPDGAFEPISLTES